MAAALERALGALWRIRMMAERQRADDDPATFCQQIIHLAESGMVGQRGEAQEAAHRADRTVRITVTFDLDRDETCSDFNDDAGEFAVSAIDAIFEMYGTVHCGNVSATAHDVTE